MPDKIHFRTNLTHRQFWKIEGKKLTTVINMESRVMIDVQDNAVYAQLLVEDLQAYRKCDAGEFETAYKDALAIVTVGKIV